MTAGAHEPEPPHGRHHACPDCGGRLVVGHCVNRDCPGLTTPPPPGPPTDPRVYSGLYSRDAELQRAQQIRAEFTTRHRNGEWH